MNILVVDDEQTQRTILKDILEDAGYLVTLAKDGEEALKRFADSAFPLVLTDLKMPKKDGLEILHAVKEQEPNVQVIIMTAFGTIPGAVSAIKDGAYDYLTKPFKKDDLLQVVGRAAEKAQLLEENNRLRREVSRRYEYANIIGKSPAMKEIFGMIERIARIDSTVLISGASGTGKELVARAIHFNGKRKNKPFVALNCGAIPETLIESELFGHEQGAFTGAAKTYIGKFEQAQEGTLFLDEIGTMRADLQIRLLRVLQEKTIERIGSNTSVKLDVRVIAATNESLEELIAKKQFRPDLYHRLNVFEIKLPPLSERKQDIALLVRHFLEKFAKQFDRPLQTLAPEALHKLEHYSFPGNVRELENIIEKTMILCDHDPITAGDLMLPEESKESTNKEMNGNGSLTDIEYDLIHQALTRSRGSIKRAAEELGISYKTLQYRMKKFGMDKNDFK